MESILIIGAGNIGTTIAAMLMQSGDYKITLADYDHEHLSRINVSYAIEKLPLDVHNQLALHQELDKHFAVLSAAPFHVTSTIARAAVKAGIHYLDLTEDVAMTRLVRDLSTKATSALIPQCGLAPGFISIVAYDLVKDFDVLDSVRMRVGALPRYPSNALNYNLTWSTDGVINEYCQPCEAIVEGHMREVPALEGLEELSLDGETYEAFNTSGGLGTLCETLNGKVCSLNYKSIRYPGHCAIMKALLRDLKLAERRDLLKDILENALPTTSQDVVVIFVTVSGEKNGRFVQETYANKIFSHSINDIEYGAIQVTTSAGICAILDQLVEGTLAKRGFIKQEDIDLNDFLANRFGAIYAQNQKNYEHNAEKRTIVFK